MAEFWSKWENRVIDGLYPLRRYVGKSNHSVVFLTTSRAHDVADAAIKLLPAPSDRALAERQLAHWKNLCALTHPHLIKLLDAGSCQLGNHPFLFVVMEHADQTLAQLLANRPLGADELSEMLRPTLKALAFLHGKHLVHGQIKPPNILVVGDQLKLSSDNISAAGKLPPRTAKASPYDPPELQNIGSSAAGDVWGLGVTMVEALTQTLPKWSVDESAAVSLPGSIPAAFADTTRRCLSRNPGDRPTVAQLKLQYDPPPPEPAVVASPAPASESAEGADSRRKPPKLPLSVGALAMALIAVVALWTVFRPRHPHAAPPVSAGSVPPAVPLPAPPPAAQAADPPAASPADVAALIVHEEIPDVPRSARESIRGIIKVTVRVSVDRAGNVVDTALESRTSSQYFAQMASQAARKWRFAAADHPNSRQWLLRFEFTRSGTKGYAAAKS